MAIQLPITAVARPGAGAAYVFTLCSSSAQASEVVRVGLPPNPVALGPGVTSGPILGATWDPVIDHTTFMPAATLDLLMVTHEAANVPTPFGTLLCELSGGARFQGLTSPGIPFEMQMPSSCVLIGSTVCAQGASVDGAGVLAFTNALDLTIGTF